MKSIRAKAQHSHLAQVGDSEGPTDMGLKAPSILTFMISVILVVVVIVAKFFGASIPVISGNEFYVLLLAHAVLVLGCILRGL